MSLEEPTQTPTREIPPNRACVILASACDAACRELQDKQDDLLTRFKDKSDTKAEPRECK